MGEPVELEMVGAEPVVEAVERLTQRGRRLVGTQPECGYAVERHTRENTESTDSEPGDLEQLGFLFGGALDDRSVGQHRRHRTNLSCETGESRPGAVCSGGDRSGDGLDVDVAEIGQRETECPQMLAQVMQRVPARTLTSAPVAVGDTVSIPVIRSSDRRVPSVTATPVNEWPAPTALTRRPCSAARAIAVASSAVLSGVSNRYGLEDSVRAQLCHVAIPT